MTILIILIILVIIICFLLKYRKIEHFNKNTSNKQYNICNLPGETCELGMCSISGKPCAINDLSNVGKCKTCPLALTKIPPGYCFIWDGYTDNNGKPCSGNNRENGCQNCSTGIFLPSAHCGTFPCNN